MNQDKYPLERVSKLAQELPDPVENGKAFAIDNEYGAVIEYTVSTMFDAVANKYHKMWALVGIHKAIATWSNE